MLDNLIYVNTFSCKTKQADLILQGRALIRNIHWLADAAASSTIAHDQHYNDS